MPKRTSNRPTEAELEILQVLWSLGTGTVRKVNTILNETTPVGYTTTLKLMQIMLRKGILQRDVSHYPQLYKPTASKANIQRRFVGDLLKRVFEGSASQLALQLLSTKKVSSQEIAEIRRLLQEYETTKINE